MQNDRQLYYMFNLFIKCYKSMISKQHMRNYMHILNYLNEKNANLHTQKELSEYLEVSLRKINDFINGKIYDFWLLSDYADILGEELTFWLRGKYE